MGDCLAHFNSSDTYNCTNPIFKDCVNQVGFDFPTLLNITLLIQLYCPTDPRLFLVDNTPATTDNAALTNAACKSFVPESWTKYAAAVIWARLQTWKIPLFQLALSTPRPPLRFFGPGLFVLVHLMGDPMGTINDLRKKLSRCGEHALYFKKRGLPLREWKALAMICIAFDEWGQGYIVQDILGAQLYVLDVTIEENITNVSRLVTSSIQNN